MSAMSGMPMPPVDPAAAKSKSATSLAAGHGRVAVELYLPQSEVKQLATTIMGFVQMAQQQAQQQMQRQMQQMQPPGELQKEKPAAPQEQKKPAASDVGQITTDPPADELCPETPDAPEDQ
jgi:hypothetical protein